MDSLPVDSFTGKFAFLHPRAAWRVRVRGKNGAAVFYESVFAAVAACGPAALNCAVRDAVRRNADFRAQLRDCTRPLVFRGSADETPADGGAAHAKAESLGGASAVAPSPAARETEGEIAAASATVNGLGDAGGAAVRASRGDGNGGIAPALRAGCAAAGCTAGWRQLQGSAPAPPFPTADWAAPNSVLRFLAEDNRYGQLLMEVTAAVREGSEPAEWALAAFDGEIQRDVALRPDVALVRLASGGGADEVATGATEAAGVPEARGGSDAPGVAGASAETSVCGLDPAKPVWTVGKAPGCDAPLLNPTVSRVHALITVLVSGAAAVVDLNSTSGTFVDGKRVEPLTLCALDRPDIPIRFAQSTKIYFVAVDRSRVIRWLQARVGSAEREAAALGREAARQRAPGRGGGRTAVWVQNLPPRATLEEVEEFFAPCGTVAAAEFVDRGRARLRFAFHAGAAAAVLRDGAFFQTRPIRVAFEEGARAEPYQRATAAEGAPQPPGERRSRRGG